MIEVSFSAVAVLTAGLAITIPLIMGFFTPKRKLAGQHVVISGGSKGIGLALAEEFVRRGCHVTVIARSKQALQEALADLTALAQSLGLSTKVQVHSACTTNHEQVARALTEAEAVAGPVDILVCNAGMSIPGRFLEQDLSVFHQQVNVNYIGYVNTIKCALPGMVQRGKGHIVVVASSAAVLGFAGYSSYCPTKWAVRGLADCLRNELQGTGVAISVGYPPDTDTPGYANENETKPDICKAVNAALGSELYPVSKVAKAMIGGIERGVYHLPTPDLGQVLLIDSMASISPKAMPSPLGCLVAPITYLVTAFLRGRADAAARKCNRAAAAAGASSSK